MLVFKNHKLNYANINHRSVFRRDSLCQCCRNALTECVIASGLHAFGACEDCARNMKPYTPNQSSPEMFAHLLAFREEMTDPWVRWIAHLSYPLIYLKLVDTSTKRKRGKQPSMESHLVDSLVPGATRSTYPDVKEFLSIGLVRRVRLRGDRRDFFIFDRESKSFTKLLRVAKIADSLNSWTQAAKNEPIPLVTNGLGLSERSGI